MLNILNKLISKATARRLKSKCAIARTTTWLIVAYGLLDIIAGRCKMKFLSKTQTKLIVYHGYVAYFRVPEPRTSLY
jgi:hypothetical protein